jgi:DNA-binding CsgD family transcriptional regulator
MTYMTTNAAREPRGLSHARTSFVGRSDAVDKVAGLLAQYRLVTVTGLGGVGKTRLAGEVLRQVGGRFADGVWVAELAAVTDPALVPAMVATVLGLHQAPGVPIVDALAAWCAAQIWLGKLARGAADIVSVVLNHSSAVVAALKDGPPSPHLVDGLLGLAAALSNMGQPVARPRLTRLSPRERELVTLVAQGRTDAQFAGQLFISVRTVRTHLDRIRDKSGCRRRADLTRLALQEGII